MLAVAHDRSGHALGDRGDLATDDEAAVVIAGDVRFDDDVPRPALAQGPREGRLDSLLRTQVEVHAPAVVAVEWLYHAGETELARGCDGRLGGIHDLGTGNRQSGRIQQPVGQVLVGRDIDGDPARP